ncbi:hypothetical protein PASE110613_09230 [Paenibacillus sediminis]|uniref:Uncharacterized protein n=1 Tax=Paenibacillus sediminis TaxID=664909 RepID=A0ABS4H6Q7_9BACL|nr:hypothetical protein [Paenibacillus sediminis]MBP1938171.1 hypothetical protein [Paenibacillus sediminis]
MYDFDRFRSPGPNDEPRVAAYCVWCDGEIYAGDEMTTYANGDQTHDGHCENEYVRAELGIERVTAE